MAPDLTATGLPVVIASYAVLCPDCLGDWCASCGWSGLSQPRRQVVSVIELPVDRQSIRRRAA